MGSSTETLIVELAGKVDKYNSTVVKALENTKSKSKGAQQGLKDVQDRAVKLNEIGSKALMRFAGVVVASFATGKVLEYADAYTRLQNKIRTVIDPTQDLGTVTGELLALANDTRGAVDATAELYSKLKRNTKELGLSQEDLLSVTSNINKAFAIGGATTAESTGAIRQLAQALASGALRGDEFNSVAEGAPIIMEAIAAATGKTKGELRELAADGKISADILIQSLQAYTSVIENDFSKAQMTAAQASEILNNNMTVLIGELDKSTGFSAGSANSLLVMSDVLTGMQPILLSTIESFKDFTGVIKNNFEGQSDDLELLADKYKSELAFMGELVKSFAWLVETGLLAVPVVIKEAVTVAIASIAALIDGAQIKIMEFRKWVAEAMGNDDTAAIIQSQIDAMGTGAADTLDMVLERSKERLSTLSQIVAENDAAMLEERTRRLTEQDEKELEMTKARLQAQAEIEAEFAEGAVIDIDEETSHEREEREMKEREKLRKELLKSRERDEKIYAKEDRRRKADIEKAEKQRVQSHIKFGEQMAASDKNFGQMALDFTKQKASASIMAYAAEGAEKAISQLGVYGIPVAGAILAGGALLSQKVSSIGMGDSGNIGSATGSGGGEGGGGASITTTELPQQTSTLDVSLAGDEGSSSSQIVIMAPPGDSLSQMMAEWLNEGIKKGRIG